MSVSPTGDPQVGKLIDLIRSLDTVKRRLNGKKKNTKSLYRNACPFVLVSLLLPLLVLPLYCFHYIALARHLDLHLMSVLGPLSLQVIVVSQPASSL